MHSKLTVCGETSAERLAALALVSPDLTNLERNFRKYQFQYIDS